MTAALPTSGLARQVGLHAERQAKRLLADRAGLVGVVLAPILYFLGFYVPLSGAMSARGLDYAQYIGPALVVQSCIFTAIASATALADDARAGLLRRVASMPVSGQGPLLGRLLVDVACGLVGAVAACVIAALVGFRFSSVAGALGFALVVVAFTVAMSLLFVGVALRASDPAGAAEALLVPQLLLLMISTAFIPLDGFPGWLQPVVAWQPVSRVLDALRGFAEGTPGGFPVLVALVWCALLAVGGLLLGAGRRAGGSDA